MSSAHDCVKSARKYISEDLNTLSLVSLTPMHYNYGELLLHLQHLIPCPCIALGYQLSTNLLVKRRVISTVNDNLMMTSVDSENTNVAEAVLYV